MKSRLLLPLVAVMLLLGACATKPQLVPVAVVCPVIPDPPPEVVKSVTTHDSLTLRLSNSVQTLSDSYKLLGESLNKAIVPK